MTDAPNARAMRLTMTFDVESAIQVFPRPQIYLGTAEGRPISVRLLLRRNDGEPLEIDVKDFDDPSVSVSSGPVGEKDSEIVKGLAVKPGDLWLEARLSGEVVESRTAKLWVHTNHPDLEDFEVPVTIRVRPLIEARPGSVSFLVPARGAPRRVNMFRLHHHGQKNFTVTSVEPADPSLVTALVATKGSATSHTLHVTLDASVGVDGRATTHSTSLVVRTDDPDKPKLRIPVEITVEERSEPLQSAPPMPMATGTPTP